jgi:tetratricopeptide (TPR) repeat protein
MINDYKSAFRNFRKAAKLYEKIGDKVSYAYTLWGFGITHSLIGNNVKANNYLLRSMKLFQETKDARGIIYCRLGLGQLALIDREDSLAKRHIEASLNASLKNSFRVETCHAKILMSLIDHYGNSLHSQLDKQGSVGDNREIRGFHGKRYLRCYNSLGLKLRVQGLPMNIP